MAKVTEAQKVQFGAFMKDVLVDLDNITKKIAEHGLDKGALLSLCISGDGYINIIPHQFEGMTACRLMGGDLVLCVEDRVVLAPGKGAADADI